MTIELTDYEAEYYQRVMSLFEEYGAKAQLREQVSIQLMEHMEESRLNGEDFQTALGAPEDFAFEYLEGAGAGPASMVKTASNPATAKADRRGRSVRLLTSGLAIALLLIYYSLAQGIAAMFLTTSMVIPEPGFTFNLWYRIASHPWYNLQLILTNGAVAAVLTAATIWGIRKALRTRRVRQGEKEEQ